MSSNVTLTSATRQNLLSLQDTASLTATTQNRLSTGLKVSSALDKNIPAPLDGYIAAEKDFDKQGFHQAM